MFGVNYKYALNESKGTIKLRPTIPSLIAYTAVAVVSSLVPLVILSALVDAHEQIDANATLNTEDDQ